MSKQNEMLTYLELNKILRLDDSLFIAIKNNELIAISKNNKQYQKISFAYQRLILSEIFYKSFVKQNKLNYKVTKYYYFIDKNKKYKRTTKINDTSQVYFILYQCILLPLNDVLTQEQFNLKLQELKINNGSKPSLLIHSCCGPCSSYVISYLQEYFKITILYYNPNIYPNLEYQKRVETQQKIINALGYDIDLIARDYNHNDYLNAIKGDESLGEGSRRCYKCYTERLEKTCLFAKDKYDFFTTTLSISPHKNSNWINEIGLMLQEKYEVKYLYSDFKQNDGYKKSILLSKKYNLYRQEYCGCEFSLKDKE